MDYLLLALPLLLLGLLMVIFAHRTQAREGLWTLQRTVRRDGYHVVRATQGGVEEPILLWPYDPADYLPKKKEPAPTALSMDPEEPGVFHLEIDERMLHNLGVVFAHQTYADPVVREAARVAVQQMSAAFLSWQDLGHTSETTMRLTREGLGSMGAALRTIREVTGYEGGVIHTTLPLSGGATPESEGDNDHVD